MAEVDRRSAGGSIVDGTTSFITATNTIPANDFATLWVATTALFGGTLTISDPSRTWSQVDVQQGPTAGTLWCFSSQETSATSSEATLNFSVAVNDLAYSCESIAGIDNSGGGGIVQVAKTNGTSNAPLVNLAAFDKPSNITLGAFALFAASRALTAGSIWAQLGHPPDQDNCELMTQYKQFEDTTFDATINGSTGWAGIALELKTINDGAIPQLVSTPLTRISTTSQTSHTFPYEIPAIGSNIRLMVTMGSVTIGATHDSVTYGGVPMTKVIERLNGTQVLGSIWTLANPPTGAQDIVATFGLATSSAEVSARAYKNCDQTSVGNSTSVSATSATSVSASIASAETEVVMDHLFTNNGTTTVPGTDQRANASINSRAHVSQELGATSTTMSWSWVANRNLAYMIVGLKAPGPISTNSVDIAVTGQAASVIPGPITLTASPQNISLSGQPASATAVGLLTVLPESIAITIAPQAAIATPSTTVAAAGTVIATEIFPVVEQLWVEAIEHVLVVWPYPPTILNIPNPVVPANAVSVLTGAQTSSIFSEVAVQSPGVQIVVTAIAASPRVADVNPIRLPYRDRATITYQE